MNRVNPQEWNNLAHCNLAHLLFELQTDPQNRKEMVINIKTHIKNGSQSVRSEATEETQNKEKLIEESVERKIGLSF